jgi:hypothetical protein
MGCPTTRQLNSLLYSFSNRNPQRCIGQHIHTSFITERTASPSNRRLKFDQNYGFFKNNMEIIFLTNPSCLDTVSMMKFST